MCQRARQGEKSLVFVELVCKFKSSSLFLGSLRLLSTCVPAQPGCSRCPDARRPRENNRGIDGAGGNAAAPCSHLLRAGLRVQLLDFIILLPPAICPRRSRALLAHLSHPSGVSSRRPLPAPALSSHLFSSVEPVAIGA